MPQLRRWPMSLGFKPTRQPRCTTMVSRSEEEFGRTARREAVSSRDCHKHGSCDVDPVAVETENLIPQHIEPRCSEPTCGQHETAEAAMFIRQGETATEVAIIRIHGAGQAFYRIATVSDRPAGK